MFDLEFAIETWRRTFLAREGASAARADELEDHLRQEVERLRAATHDGAEVLSTEEAFLLAVRRLGRVEQIANEFAAADPAGVWRRRAIWMITGYIAVGFVIATSAAFASLTYLVSRDMSTGWRLGLYSAAALAAAFAFAGLARSFARSGRRIPAWVDKALRSDSGLVGLTLLVIVSKLALMLLPALVMSRLVAPSMFGLMSSSDRSTTALFSVTILTFLPFIALAWLIRRELRHPGREVGLEARG
jgi:hypothetical protein